MALQLPNFQRISFDEANPLLTGISKGQQLMQSAMQFPQDLKSKMLANQIAQVQAKYAEPLAQTELTKNQLFNQYYPQDIQSQIGLRGAQSNLYGQQAKWFGPSAQADIELKKAEAGLQGVEAQQKAMLVSYLRQKANQQKAGEMLSQSANMPTTATSGTSSVTPNTAPVTSGTSSNQQNNNSLGGMPSSSTMQTSTPATPMNQNVQQPTLPSNTVYGIPTPEPSVDDIINKNFLGIDTFSKKFENATTQQQDQYTQYQKVLADTIQEANSAQRMQDIMKVYNQAMDNSTYKGQFLGTLPSSGLLTTLLGNMAPEQTVDNMANQAMPFAIAQLRDAMGSAKFSNLDMRQSQNMKFGRTLDDESRRVQTAWLSAVGQRMEEKAKFYQMMGNPQSGAQKTQADLLWQQYQENFPLISGDGKNVNTSNMNKWPLYTTPKALNSIQSTGMYKPTSAEKNSTWMWVPADASNPNPRIVPIKPGKVEQAIKLGARPL